MESNENMLSGSFNRCSAPSQLKITDVRFTDVIGAPMHCTLMKIYTNQGIVGLGEVRDGGNRVYAEMLKSRILGENPCNVEKLFRRIRQFGGPARQGGGVCGIEIALWDLVGKAYGVPVYQMLGGKYRDRIRIYCDNLAGSGTRVLLLRYGGLTEADRAQDGSLLNVGDQIVLQPCGTDLTVAERGWMCWRNMCGMSAASSVMTFPWPSIISAISAWRIASGCAAALKNTILPGRKT